MMSPHEISDVRLTPASETDAERGLVGFVMFRLGPVQVDGVTVRRTRVGDLSLSFPARRDRSGRAHPYLRPLDDATHREIEAEVIAALESQGVLP